MKSTDECKPHACIIHAEVDADHYVTLVTAKRISSAEGDGEGPRRRGTYSIVSHRESVSSSELILLIETNIEIQASLHYGD
jgi:hypothetical protein